MTCPVCAFSGDPAAKAAVPDGRGHVVVCAGCGASLLESYDIMRDAMRYRLAVGDDTTRLSADDLATLRKARGLARRKA